MMARCLGVFLLLLFVKLITCLLVPEPTMRYVSSRSHHIATFLRDAERINGSHCTGFPYTPFHRSQPCACGSGFMRLPKVDKSVLFRSHRWSGEMWFERRVVSR